jgi:hypothetical protein
VTTLLIGFSLLGRMPLGESGFDFLRLSGHGIMRGRELQAFCLNIGVAISLGRRLAIRHSHKSDAPMINLNLTAVIGSLLLVFTSPVDRGSQSKGTHEQCNEIAAAAMSNAMRVIGDPTDQRVNRVLLRELGCLKAPTIKTAICEELARRASQIGSQGTPGYQNIRELMSDMSC